MLPPGGCDEHNLYWGGGGGESLAEKSNTQPQSSATCFGTYSQSLQTLGISRATTDQAKKGKSERSRVCRGGGSSWKAGDTEKPPIITLGSHCQPTLSVHPAQLVVM